MSHLCWRERWRGGNQISDPSIYLSALDFGPRKLDPLLVPGECLAHAPHTWGAGRRCGRHAARHPEGGVRMKRSEVRLDHFLVGTSREVRERHWLAELICSHLRVHAQRLDASQVSAHQRPSTR